MKAAGSCTLYNIKQEQGLYKYGNLGDNDREKR